MSSVAVCGRFAGSFSRQRRMRSTSGTGALGRTAESSGGVARQLRGEQRLPASARRTAAAGEQLVGQTPNE